MSLHTKHRIAPSSAAHPRSDQHAPGTADTVVGTDSTGALEEFAVSKTATTEGTIPLHNANGDIIVPASPSSAAAAASKDYVDGQITGAGWPQAHDVVGAKHTTTIGASKVVVTNGAGALSATGVTYGTTATADLLVQRDAAGQIELPGASPTSTQMLRVDKVVSALATALHMTWVHGTQRIQHSDLTAAAHSESIAITGFPADSFPLGVIIELDTAFSGGLSSSAAVEIGDAGNTDEWMAATSVFAGVAAGLYTDGGAGAVAAGRLLMMWFEDAYTPVATVTADVDVVDLDAGDLYVHWWALTPTAAT